MNRRQACDRFAELRHLRGLSTQVAQGRALAAAQAQRDAEADARAEAVRLDDYIAAWQAGLASGTFDPTAATAWGVAVQRQAGHVHACDNTVVERDHHRVVAQQAYDRAVAEEELARSLLRRAIMRAARQDEERQLAQREDDSTWQALTR